ncbi:hypothetical protein OIE52_19455 [Streptomyces canus]|uniref:hypothetical protein n=1 Tax=Streptomyces canus TaxID=58343 RepID=UPI002E27F629|nr:hypothetical protein [Streptomyces canus]
MSLPVGSRWTIKRSSVGTETIEIIGSQGETFTAKYVSTTDPSKFSGEVGSRQHEVITLKQHNVGPKYVAYHSGLREASNGTYTGSWYDVAGNKGDFSLVKQ